MHGGKARLSVRRVAPRLHAPGQHDPGALDPVSHAPKDAVSRQADRTGRQTLQQPVQLRRQKAPKEPEEKPAFRDEVHYYLELARTALLAAVKKFGKYLVITVRKIDITVSGDDPAKIALTYGYAVQTAAYIKELADNTLKTKYRGEAPNIAVGVDWLSGKSSIVLDISMKIRVWQIISVLFTALKGYISVDKPKPEKKDKNDKDGETAEAAPGNGNKPAMAVNGG